MKNIILFIKIFVEDEELVQRISETNVYLISTHWLNSLHFCGPSIQFIIRTIQYSHVNDNLEDT